MTDHWSTRYIGQPWIAHGRGEQGFDCWGLVRHVYARELNIDLPCLAGEYADPAERREIDALRLNDPSLSVWRDIPATHLGVFDVLLFGGAYLHVGVAIDRQRMLHIDRGRVSEVARLDRGRWRLAAATVARHTAMETVAL